jgi:hypothetical protein
MHARAYVHSRWCALPACADGCASTDEIACELRTTFGPKSPSMTGETAVAAGESAGAATRIDLRRFDAKSRGKVSASMREPDVMRSDDHRTENLI